VETGWPELKVKMCRLKSKVGLSLSQNSVHLQQDGLDQISIESAFGWIRPAQNLAEFNQVVIGQNLEEFVRVIPSRSWTQSTLVKLRPNSVEFHPELTRPNLGWNSTEFSQVCPSVFQSSRSWLKFGLVAPSQYLIEFDRDSPSQILVETTNLNQRSRQANLSQRVRRWMFIHYSWSINYTCWIWVLVVGKACLIHVSLL